MQTEKKLQKITAKAFPTTLCTVSSKRLIKDLKQRKRIEKILLARESLKRDKTFFWLNFAEIIFRSYLNPLVPGIH